MKVPLIHRFRRWLCFLLFEDIVDEFMDDTDWDQHKYLDRLGVPHSRIQPNGCYDGINARIADALEHRKVT